jgi:hypothetical protein
MTQLAVDRPLDERDRHDDLGPHPVRADPGQTLRLREQRRRDLDRVEALPQIDKHPRVEPGADLPGEHEVVMLVATHQQRPQAYASTLRIGEAADDEVLRELTLHLQPVL